MRKLYFLFLLLFASTYAWSQVSVTASAGTTGPSSYATLKAAFDAVNAGTHKGVIAISISANTTETASAVLNASGTGASVYTAISIQPVGGAASTISGNVASTLIDLDGADNVTINGLNTGGNALTITNTNNSATAATIRFINDATNNTVTNVTVLGAGSSITTATILFANGTTTGNDNNTVSNCNIADASPDFPVNAILSTGSSTAGLENSNITISGNNVSNYFSATLASTALLVGVGNTDWTITNNRFFQTAARTFSVANTHRVIQINSGVNHTVTGNIIGYASAAATGTYTLGGVIQSKFVAIELSVGTATVSNVQNNTVAGMSFITSSNAGATLFYGVWCGVYIIGGNVNVAANTIGSNTGVSNIVVSPTVNGAFVVGISSTSTGVVSISSNNIAAIDLTPSGVNAGTLTGIQATGTGGTISITNNVIGNTTANNMRIGIAGTTTQTGIIRGIINGNGGTVQIVGNIIRNMIHNGNGQTTLLRGIEYQAGTGSISKNVVSNMSAAGFFQNFSTQVGVGILLSSSSTGISVDSNTVYNLSLTSTSTNGAVISGIYAGIPSTSSGILNGASITRNRIYDLSNATASTTAATPSCIIGIFCGNSNAANPLTIANNMIALGHGQTTNSSIIGIHSYHAAAQNYTARIYHNSIDIAGTAATGAQPSFAYYRGDFSSTALTVPTVDIRNNIFVNNRNGGSGKHYAIANGYPNASSSATGWVAGASNYNVLKAPETNLGYWSGDWGFTDWKAASAGDANSGSFVVSFVNTPSDLHIAPGGNAASINNAGTPLAAVPIDIDNDVRNVTTPDIGADEFTIPFAIGMEYFTGTKYPSNNLLTWKASCSSATTTFEVQRSDDSKHFKTIGSITATKERCAAPFAFTDASPADGINYYRLKMTEADGHISYSAIIAIINRNSGIKIVSLNPTIIEKESAVLEVSAAQAGKLELAIFDMNGKLVQRNSLAAAAGSNAVILNLSVLATGSYTLTIHAPDGSISTARFIKP